MKRYLIFLSFLVIALALSGCTVSKSFSPLAHEYLVASLGFDQSDDKKTVILEAVVVNSEDSEADKKKELLTGNGKTLKEALNKAIEKAAQPIELSHCAVAVIGENVDKRFFNEICKYVYAEEEITIALGFVSTQNAEELLSSETIASVAVGYDIVSMQQTYSRKNSVDFKNRFYEIESKRLNGKKTFSLPFFKVEQGGYHIDGKTVFKNGTPRKKADKNTLEVVAK